MLSFAITYLQFITHFNYKLSPQSSTCQYLFYAISFCFFCPKCRHKTVSVLLYRYNIATENTEIRCCIEFFPTSTVSMYAQHTWSVTDSPLSCTTCWIFSFTWTEKNIRKKHAKTISQFLIILQSLRYNFHCFSVFQQSSCTCFCYSSDKFGILLEFDVVVALILHQHHLQIDVIANLEPTHTSIYLLIQGHCCSYIAGGPTHCKEQIFDVLVLMNCTSLFLYRHTNMTFWLVCYHLFNNKPAMPFCIMPFCFEVTKSEFMYSTCSDQRNSATCFKSPYLNLMLKMYLKEKFIFLITT